MIAIIDNALSDDHFKEFKDTIDLFLALKAETLWFELGIYEDPHIRKLLHLASKYIDLSKVVGYEAWTHNNTIPIGDNDDGWHKDRDELSYHVRKIFRFPVCSIVFYTEIKDLQGGELIVEDTIITPKEKGCQISIQVKNADKKIYNIITKKGVISDWREPDVIRIAPVPIYNSYTDVYKFYKILNSVL